MCYCGNTGWNGYRNKSQHIKWTLENIFPPLLPEYEPAAFRSRVSRSTTELPTLPVCLNRCYMPSNLLMGRGPFCFTSTEARWLIRDGDRGGRRRKSEGSTADTARKKPERPWAASRTMEVLRWCPLAIAQRLVHCATAVLAWVQSQRQCPLHCC